MPKTAIELDTDLDPDVVFGGMIDFTERRPKLWPALSEKVFQVHEVGDGWAEITEGSDMPGKQVFARERYEWSAADGVVRSRVLESNWIKLPGPAEYRVTPRDGGGSHIYFSMDRSRKGPLGAVMDTMLRLMGTRFLTKYWEQHLDVLREESGAPS